MTADLTEKKTYLFFLMAQSLAGLVAEELLDALGMALGAALAGVGLAAVAAAVGVLIHLLVLIPLLQHFREKARYQPSVYRTTYKVRYSSINSISVAVISIWATRIRRDSMNQILG